MKVLDSKILRKNLVYLINDGYRVKIVRKRPQSVTLKEVVRTPRDLCPYTVTNWFTTADERGRDIGHSVNLWEKEKWLKKGAVIGIYDRTSIEDLNNLARAIAEIQMALLGSRKCWPLSTEGRSD